MRRLSLVLILVLLLIAGGALFWMGNLSTPSTALALAPTATGGVKVDATALPAVINVSSLASPRVLAWNPNNTQIAWYAASGQPVVVAQGSTPKALVIPCGITPAGDKMILYLGGDTAQPYLYPLDSGTPLSLGTNIGLVCAVPNRVQFSADGNSLALIKYDNKAVEANYTVGTLRILKMPDGSEQRALDNVVGYDLQNDGVTALEFFANTKREANSADLVFWDGSKERKIEENIKPLENCQFVAGRPVRAGDKVFTLLGEKCKVGGSKWRLLRSDFAGGNSVNVGSGPTGSNGGALYFNNSGTNDAMLLPDGKSLLITVPNGLHGDVVNVARVSLSDGALSNVLSGVVVDQYPPTAPRRFLRSPKGDRMAFVTRDGNGGEKLFIYDMSAPETQPVPIAGGNRSDRINGLAWTADGERLYYTITGDDNALIYVTTKGESKRIIRGTFQGLVISADGASAATSEQVQAGTNDLRNNLILINVNDQSKVNLVEGNKGDVALTPLILR
jgi:hypothetical protein